jgi:hypothetical protein
MWLAFEMHVQAREDVIGRPWVASAYLYGSRPSVKTQTKEV